MLHSIDNGAAGEHEGERLRRDRTAARNDPLPALPQKRPIFNDSPAFCGAVFICGGSRSGMCHVGKWMGNYSLSAGEGKVYGFTKKKL